MAETVTELFEHELRDIYDAENKLINALEKMSNDASNDQLSNTFAQHRDVTEEQTRRLERVFELIERARVGNPVPASTGSSRSIRSSTRRNVQPPKYAMFSRRARP